eukprot:974728-Amorphochlora_amoeboformis.AAC.1
MLRRMGGRKGARLSQPRGVPGLSFAERSSIRQANLSRSLRFRDESGRWPESPRDEACRSAKGTSSPNTNPQGGSRPPAAESVRFRAVS